MNSRIRILLIICLIALSVFLLSRGALQSQPTTIAGANVTIVAEQQIVTLNVQGGYSPKISIVKANMPTVLRFVTDGSYDCSTAMRIPDLGIRKNLPPTGTTDIDIGTLAVGTLQGTCSMGMYRFEIRAQ